MNLGPHLDYRHEIKVEVREHEFPFLYDTGAAVTCLTFEMYFPNSEKKSRLGTCNFLENITKSKTEFGRCHQYKHQLHLKDNLPVYHKQFPLKPEIV